jgi:FAE1/Type III polyketide synthase-like protein
LVGLTFVCYSQAYTEQSLDFMEKVLQRSGLGPETYLPDGKA